MTAESPKELPGIFSESDARSALKGAEVKLRQVVESGVRRYRESVAPQFISPTPRGRANMIHDLMIEEAVKAFGTRVVRKAGRQLLFLDPAITVQFKKLNRDLRPSNYPTQTAMAFDAQQPIPGLPPEVRLTIGYVLDGTGLELLAVYVCCMAGARAAWTYEIKLPAIATLPVKARPMPKRRFKVKLGGGSNNEAEKSGTK